MRHAQLELQVALTSPAELSLILQMFASSFFPTRHGKKNRRTLRYSRRGHPCPKLSNKAHRKSEIRTTSDAHGAAPERFSWPCLGCGDHAGDAVQAGLVTTSLMAEAFKDQDSQGNEKQLDETSGTSNSPSSSA